MAWDFDKVCNTLGTLYTAVFITLVTIAVYPMPSQLIYRVQGVRTCTQHKTPTSQWPNVAKYDNGVVLGF